MKQSWLSNSKEMTISYRIVIFLVWCFFKIFYTHKIYGQEHFLHVKGAIIAANHASFYDPPLVSISSIKELHFLARQSLFKYRLFGPFIRHLNAHPVSGEAGDAALFKMICDLVKKGSHVLLFPEGTRALTPEISQIKQGIAVLLSRSKGVIIPTYIHGSFEIWSRHYRFPRLFGKTACVFGSPISFDSFSHLEKREAFKKIQETLTLALLALKDWYEKGAKGSPP